MSLLGNTYYNGVNLGNEDTLQEDLNLLDTRVDNNTTAISSLQADVSLNTYNIGVLQTDVSLNTYNLTDITYASDTTTINNNVIVSSGKNLTIDGSKISSHTNQYLLNGTVNPLLKVQNNLESGRDILLSVDPTITEIKMNNKATAHFSLQNTASTFKIINSSSNANAFTTGMSLLSLDTTGNLITSGNLTTNGTVNGYNLTTMNNSISTNTANISTNTADISANTTSINSLNTRMTTAEADIDAVEAVNATQNTTLTSYDTRLTNLETKTTDIAYGSTTLDGITYVFNNFQVRSQLDAASSVPQISIRNTSTTNNVMCSIYSGLATGQYNPLVKDKDCGYMCQPTSGTSLNGFIYGIDFINHGDISKKRGLRVDFSSPGDFTPDRGSELWSNFFDIRCATTNMYGNLDMKNNNITNVTNLTVTGTITNPTLTGYGTTLTAQGNAITTLSTNVASLQSDITDLQNTTEEHYNDVQTLTEEFFTYFNNLGTTYIGMWRTIIGSGGNARVNSYDNNQVKLNIPTYGVYGSDACALLLANTLSFSQIVSCRWIFRTELNPYSWNYKVDVGLSDDTNGTNSALISCSNNGAWTCKINNTVVYTATQFTNFRYGWWIMVTITNTGSTTKFEIEHPQTNTPSISYQSGTPPTKETYIYSGTQPTGNMGPMAHISNLASNKDNKWLIVDYMQLKYTNNRSN